MISRHVDRGLYPSSFMYSDQWVKCPKCSYLSILKYDSPLSLVNAPYHGTFSFSCLNCCYQIKAEDSSISSRHNGHFTPQLISVVTVVGVMAQSKSKAE